MLHRCIGLHCGGPEDSTSKLDGNNIGTIGLKAAAAVIKQVKNIVAVKKRILNSVIEI